MARKGYTPEQIIGMPRDVEFRLSQGEKAGAICRARHSERIIERVPGPGGRVGTVLGAGITLYSPPSLA